MAGTDFSHLTDDELLNGIKALNIPDYIRTKSYGVDVRETLAQMTEMLMQLAYNQGMSPQQAQDWAMQLANKVDKGNLSFSDINKNLGKIDQTYLSDSLISQIAGTTAINAVPAKGSLTKDRLTKKIVGADQTDFLNRGKNLFDRNNLFAGYFINATGDLIINAGYSTTDYIGIKPNTDYVRNLLSTASFYDSSFNFISRIYETNGKITSPSNADYVRISLGNGYINSYQFEEGSKATTKEDFQLTSEVLKLKEKNFQTDIVPVTSMKGLKVGKNLFNKNDVSQGQLNMATGLVDSAIQGVTSGYIPIKPGYTYSKNKVASFSFYDENQSFIPIQLGTGSGEYHSQMSTFTSPANARYIRLNARTGLSGMQLEKGDNVTNYQPFGYYISDLLYQYDINELREDLNALSTEVVSKEVKYPTPAFIEPDISLIGGTSRSVAFVDNEDNLWAIQWDNKIYKNPVNTYTWEMVLDTKPFLESGETISGYALVVSDTGRMVVGTNKGRVLVSNTAQTTLSEAFTFKGGYTQTTWGFDKQGQYILMGSYLVNKNAENPGREVYLSKDHGETWELIFDKPIGEMEDASDYHIHDVAFDPYSGAILVVQGDTVNNQIYYSYDLGNTWKEVNPDGTSKVHPTSILCFPEGIAFGSDELPEGISWWDRPVDETEPDIKHDDVYWKKKFNLGESIIGNIAVKGATLFDETGLYGVMGFTNHNTSAPGYPRLFATGDGGRSWHQIWKSDNQTDENGFFNTLLRKTDNGIEIYSRYSIGGQPHLFKANMPEFY